MGKLPRGIDDNMIGRLGNHVGRYLRGENIIAMRPSKSNRAATQLQSLQRAKFGFLAGWLAPLSSFIDVGFKNYDADMSARNACMSYNFKQEVITGVLPNFMIDYGKLVLSRGTLEGTYLPSVETGAQVSLKFTWEDNIGVTNAQLTDDLSFVVYDPMTDKYAVAVGVVKRSAKVYSMPLPLDFSTHMVHTWMMAVSADGKMVTDSQHLGPVPVG